MQDRVNLTSMHEILNEKETSEITADLNSNCGSQTKWNICWYGENNTANPEFIQAKILFKNEVKIKIFSNKVWMPVDNTWNTKVPETERKHQKWKRETTEKQRTLGIINLWIHIKNTEYQNEINNDMFFSF